MGGQRLPPRYPHEMWNVHARVEDELPRTNNHLEEWHNRFNAFIGERHANIWKFIKGLKEDSNLHEYTRVQVLMGARPPIPRVAYRRINERLANLVLNFDQNDMINYLRGISYNLAF